MTQLRSPRHPRGINVAGISALVVLCVVTDGTIIMTGRIVTDTFATGQITFGSCGNDTWVASKRGQ